MRRLLFVLLAASALLPWTTVLADLELPSGTRVYVITKEGLVGKKDQVQVGQTVSAEIWRDVVVGGQVVIEAGTPVVAEVDSLQTRKVAGIKGKMSIAALETKCVDGQTIQLEGGYNKEGKGRIALSGALAGLVFLPLIFIPGAPAELPDGTVFDAYTGPGITLRLDPVVAPKPIDLSNVVEVFTAELLYDTLLEQEKPKYFDLRITAPLSAPDEFIIDRINGAPTDPIPLEVGSVETGDTAKSVNAQAKIKTLAKRFRKGVNTIDIAYETGEGRVATELVVNIEF